MDDAQQQSLATSTRGEHEFRASSTTQDEYTTYVRTSSCIVCCASDYPRAYSAAHKFSASSLPENVSWSRREKFNHRSGERVARREAQRHRLR